MVDDPEMIDMVEEEIRDLLTNMISLAIKFLLFVDQRLKRLKAIRVKLVSSYQ